VDAPSVMVTAPNMQRVGDPLTLTCSITAVQGVIAIANITWTANGNVLQMTPQSVRIDDVPVFVDNYTIPMLNMADDGRMYRCEVVVINASPPVMASGGVTLDVMGKCFAKFVRTSVYFHNTK